MAVSDKDAELFCRGNNLASEILNKAIHGAKTNKEAFEEMRVLDVMASTIIATMLLNAVQSKRGTLEELAPLHTKNVLLLAGQLMLDVDNVVEFNKDGTKKGV